MYIHHMADRGMVRKQVYLTAAQNAQLRRMAKQQGRSEAEILREALQRHLEGTLPGPAVRDDTLWSLIGIAQCDDEDLSESVDEHLYGGR
jgi:hypothetical protein